MANEWVKVELYGANNDGNPRRYTIADGTAVSQGTVLQLNDARTVVPATATSTAFAGVASEDHIPNIGVTSVAAWTDGVFEATASGAIEVGAGVFGVENNKVMSGAVGVYSVGAGILGYVLETATNAEVINVRLQL